MKRLLVEVLIPYFSISCVIVFLASSNIKLKERVSSLESLTMKQTQLLVVLGERVDAYDNDLSAHLRKRHK